MKKDVDTRGILGGNLLKFHYNEPRIKRSYSIAVISLKDKDSRTFSIWCENESMDNIYRYNKEVINNIKLYKDDFIEMDDDFKSKKKTHVIVITPYKNGKKGKSKSFCVRIINYSANDIANVLMKVFL